MTGTLREVVVAPPRLRPGHLASGPGGPGGDDGFYAAHQKVYPREIKGRFASLRRLAMFILLGLYYGVAWLQWDERQAVLFDLPARKFYIFGLTLWPQDFIFLTLLLVIAALSLFFFTAVAGRLWCGYACPQTVWTEAFLVMERWVEGDRAQRMKRDAGVWNLDKLWRKSVKHSLWIVFALWTGFTFVGYFTPIRELGLRSLDLSLGPWETFWVFFYGFATWGNAGFMREQVCKYMCPYARFQSAMFDKDTLIITYDSERGEPRGARRRGSDPRSQGLGDCIDCTMCVQVCPTGIDIRNGLQYECIACAACIDACDGVMDRMGYARGLIRYTTQHALDHKATHVIRPRVLVYGTLLVVLIATFSAALSVRSPVGLDVIRDRKSLYRILDDGRAENVYLLKILNKSDTDRRFRVRVEGPGELSTDPGDPVFGVRAGEVFNGAIRVRRDAYAYLGSQPIALRVTAEDDPRVTARAETRFISPSQ